MTERGEQPKDNDHKPDFSFKRSANAWGRNQRPANERSILKQFRGRKQKLVDTFPKLLEENPTQSTDDK